MRRLTEQKMRSGQRTGLQSVAAVQAIHCRLNMQRTAPETINETKKKKIGAEKSEVPGAVQNPTRDRQASSAIDCGEFERKVVKVFEREGYGYEGLLMLPTGQLEQTFEELKSGAKSFNQAIESLLNAYRAGLG